MPVLSTQLNARSADFKANAYAMRAVIDDLNAKLAKIAEHSAGRGVERADVLVDLVAGDAGTLRDLVHGRDEFRDARDERVFERAHVFVSARENLLQQVRRRVFS